MRAWAVQPDFQYIFRPGGGSINPLNRFADQISDAAVFGVRKQISFWLALQHGSYSRSQRSCSGLRGPRRRPKDHRHALLSSLIIY
jgi:hypothetical protein